MRASRFVRQLWLPVLAFLIAPHWTQSSPGAPSGKDPGEDTSEPDGEASSDSPPSPTRPDGTKVGPPPRGGNAKARESWLAARLSEILANSPLSNANARAQVGVAISDVASGRTLFGRAEKGLFNAASNVKLLTTATALSLLGPDFRWRTVVYAEPQAFRGDSVVGDLYLKGFGDPGLTTSGLNDLAADLAALGLRKVTGTIAIDDSYFDPETIPPAFEQKKEDAYYRAPAGAASVNSNAVDVLVMPGASDGAPARTTLDPISPYFEVRSTATTVANGRTNLRVSVKPRTGKPARMEVVITGTIRIDEVQFGVKKRVEHPDAYLAHTFMQALARHGITVVKKVPRKGVVKPTAPGQPLWRTLAARFSAPLALQIREVNKRSNNFMAEQLVKTIGAETTGRPGSWASGLGAIQGALRDMGIPPSDYQLANGSGLYDSNKISPDVMVRLLRHAYRDFRYSADFVASLAIGGVDGTMGKRLEGTGGERYVRAKTGTLATVVALSGYAGATGKPPVAFAILINGIADGSAKRSAKLLQDEVVQAIVAFLESSPAG